MVIVLATKDKPLHVWRITDGKAGHDTQSLGLSIAISRIVDCQIHHVPVPSFNESLIGLLIREFKAGKSLPDPDLIIGAGHSTHFPMLCGKRARGGNNIVIMKPTVPLSWFDLCLIPEHDNPQEDENVVITTGVLNTIRPSSTKNQNSGLLLIGGPSKHYLWNEDLLLDQIDKILIDHLTKWVLIDSPRTPITSRHLFKGLKKDNLQYRTYTETSRNQLEELLARSAVIWVTEDSMSMIYEALTARGAVGILSVPAKQAGRIPDSINDLAKNNHCTLYADWETGQELSVSEPLINEAERCARIVLDRFKQTKTS